jgi:hypothetical protein
MIESLLKRTALVTLATLALLIGLPIHATTLRKLSLNELVEHADSIVVGKCEKVESVWLEKKIYTIANIRVSHSAKGQTVTDDTIQLYELGGTVEKPLPVKMLVTGAATLVQHEEALFFLEKFGNKKQFSRLVGMAQGKVLVTADGKTGKKQVHYGEPIKGVQWVDRNGKAVAPGAAAAREEPAEPGSLEGFLGRIHKIKTEQETAAKKRGVK